MPVADTAFGSWILGSMSSGVVAIDAQGAVVMLNPGAQRILGCPKGEPGEVLGKPQRPSIELTPHGLFSVLPFSRLPLRDHPLQLILHLLESFLLCLERPQTLAKETLCLLLLSFPKANKCLQTVFLGSSHRELLRQ